MTAPQLEQILKEKGFHPSQLSKNRKGNFVYRKGFFYTMGNSAYKIAESLKNEFPNIEIVETKDVWKAFRGGSTVSQSSHFYIEFKFIL